MTDDDDDAKRRAELARLGIARAGIARGGLARAGYAPTPTDILKRVLVEHADFRKRLEMLEAAIAALQTARRKGGHQSKKKSHRDLRKLVRELDAIVRELHLREKKSAIPDAARVLLPGVPLEGVGNADARREGTRRG